MTKPIFYKRSRFSTYLSPDYLYAPSHFWLSKEENGQWRVGFTKFATRMLGEAVECNFETAENDAVQLGQVIGSLEAFKAMTDLYCVVEGRFLNYNPGIDQDCTIISSFPYDKGWLYRVEGTPDAQCVGVDGYIQLLDETIDKLQTQEGDKDNGNE